MNFCCLSENKHVYFAENFIYYFVRLMYNKDNPIKQNPGVKIWIGLFSGGRLNFRQNILTKYAAYHNIILTAVLS